MKVNPGLPWHKQHSTRSIISSPYSGLELRKQLVKCYIWGIALDGDDTWTLREVDHKYLESFEMWCWRRMEKFSWSERVKMKDYKELEEINILHTIKRRNWIGYIWRRNCLLTLVVGGKIEGT